MMLKILGGIGLFSLVTIGAFFIWMVVKANDDHIRWG